MVTGPSDEQKVTIATETLALLNQQTDAVRAELLALRQDLAQVQRDFTSIPAAQLLEANEQLVIAAMRAQAIADTARRRLAELTRSGPVVAMPQLSMSGELARANYQQRVGELREANEQLVLAALSSQELEAEAAQAHTRQITFLAMAAHELRNPLLPLRLAAQMITRARTDEQLLLKLQATINSQVSHMARLIGDLLDGSRISTGKFRLERTTVDLCRVLAQAIETSEPAIEARHHQFTYKLPDCPLHVHGDAVRLVQVFSNLLENSAKYTPEGGELSLVTTPVAGKVTITVSDNGIGITADTLPHVFELFVQDKVATVLNQGGLGIGLAVVRELVEAHGGTVVARSAGPDLGSQFVVTLPLAPSAPPGVL
ncbi:MAG: sensor histidine kinase [Ramlibacter sp.]|nr:sensor histidine kinase [Ramlibacter sp.]